MDNEMSFAVTLKDRASAQAKVIADRLRGFNAHYTTTVSMNLVDNMSSKMRTIFSAFRAAASSLFLDIPSSFISKMKGFGNAMSGMFKNDGSKKWFEKIYGFFRELEKSAVRIGDVLSGIFVGGGAAITAGITAVSAILSKQMISINSEMEQFEVALQTTLGGLTEAKLTMAKIVDFAKATPYEIKNITEAAVKLSSYDMGLDKWLEPLGNAASAFNRDITNAVEMAADVVTGQFRRALSYGIKLDRVDFKEGGKYAGREYADVLLEILEDRFASGMVLQSRTLKGIWSNLKDLLYIQFQQSTQPLYAYIKKQISSIYDFLNSAEGKQKLQELIDYIVATMNKIVDVAKKIGSYFITNLLPVFKDMGKTMMHAFGEASEMLSPLVSAVTPLIAIFGSILKIMTAVVGYSDTLLKIFISFSVATKIMKMLGFSVGKLSNHLVASGKASSILAAKFTTLSSIAVGLGASMAAAFLIGNYVEVKNNLKEIGDSIKYVADNAADVKQYLLDIGENTNHDLKEMSKIALVAKEFGRNMSNVIEVTSAATGKAKEGLASNLTADSEKVAEVIGTMAAAFIDAGDSLDEMRFKTQAAGEILVELDRISSETGYTFEDMAQNIGNYVDVLTTYKDNIGELRDVIQAFGLAAGQATEEADVALGNNLSTALETMKMLLNPTKDMFLSLPIDTWTSYSFKNMEDMSSYFANVAEPTAEGFKAAKENAEALKQTLKDTLTMDDIKKLFNYDKDSVRVSEAIKDNQIEGAKAQLEASEKWLEVLDKTNKSTFSATDKQGKIGDANDALSSNWKWLATALTAIAAASVVGGLRRVKKVNSSINDSITGAGAGRAGNTIWQKMLIKSKEKLLARALPKNMLGRIEKATEMQTAALTKEYGKRIKDLEKELAAQNKRYNSFIMSRLTSAGGGGNMASNIPEGMTAKEYLSRWPEQMMKKMSKDAETAFKYKDYEFTTKIAELEKKLADTRADGVKAIKDMIDAHSDLADAFKKGKVPLAMKDLANSIKEMTENARVARGSGIKLAASRTKNTVKETPSLIRKIPAGALLNVLDKNGWEQAGKAFRDGFTLRNTSTTLRGGSRITNDISSLDSAKSASNRAYGLTVGPYFSKLMGKLNIFKGQRGGAGLEGLGKIADVFSKRKPLTGEELEKQLLKLSDRTAEQVAEYGKSIVPDTLEGKLPVKALVRAIAQYTDSVSEGIELAAKDEAVLLGDRYVKVTRKNIDFLKDLMDKGTEMKTPVQVTMDSEGRMLVLDGHHRIIAAMEKGMKELKVEVSGLKTLGTSNDYSGFISSMEKELNKVFPKLYEITATSKSKDFIKSLKSLFAIEGRDANGRFLPGNSNAFTSETAIRMTTAAKAAERAAEEANKLENRLAKAAETLKQMQETSYKAVATEASRAASGAESRMSQLITKAVMPSVSSRMSDLVTKAVGAEDASRRARETKALFDSMAGKANGVGYGEIAKADDAIAKMAKAAEDFKSGIIGNANGIGYDDIAKMDAAAARLTSALENSAVASEEVSKTIAKTGSSKISKGINAAFAIELGNSVSEAFEPYLKEQANQGKNINAYAAQQTWKKMMGGPVGDVATVSGTAAMGAMPELIPVAIAIGGAADRIATVLTEGPKEGRDYQTEVGTAWDGAGSLLKASWWKGLSADVELNSKNFFKSAYGAAKGIITSTADAAKNLVARAGSLATGGWGKLPQADYSVTQASWGDAAVEREKAIEEQYKKTKDLAAREAAYQQLLDEKVAINTKKLTDKKAGMLQYLTELANKQAVVLTESGKFSTDDVSKRLTEEISRADKWVSSNIHFGTDITDDLVNNFENGGTLSAEAFAIAMENELAKVDLNDGFDEFLSSIDDEEIALTLGVAALEKLDAQYKEWQKKLEDYNKKLSEQETIVEDLTAQIKGLDSQISKLEQTMNNVTNAFDLALAYNELKYMNSGALELETTIADLNVQLAKSEYEMLPLTRALEGAQKAFDEVQSSIDKAQEALDGFLNAPIEGEKEYRNQLYDIDRQIAQLNRNKLDLQPIYDRFADAKMLDTDAYKKWAAETGYALIDSKIQALQNNRDIIESDRDLYTMETEHIRDIAQLGTEMTQQAIQEGIAKYAAEVAALQPVLAEKQKELDMAQQAVDKEQEKIDKIEYALQLRNSELEILQSQKTLSDMMVTNAQKRAEAQQRIYELEASITDQKMLQLAQEAAAGRVTSDQLKAVLAIYKSSSKDYYSKTGERTELQKQLETGNEEVERLTQLISDTESAQDTLSQKMDALVTQLGQFIKGLNLDKIAGVDRSVLEKVFGQGLAIRLANMSKNLEVIAKHSNAKEYVKSNYGMGNVQLVDKYGNIIGSYADGGIAQAADTGSLALLHGTEAVVPLEGGAIPVNLSGNTGGDNVTVTNTFGNITIVVNNEEELEEVKKAILALRQGQTSFFSRASQYTERH